MISFFFFFKEGIGIVIVAIVIIWDILVVISSWYTIRCFFPVLSDGAVDYRGSVGRYSYSDPALP